MVHNLCFSFLLDITAVPGEIENNAYAKFLGANKVYYVKPRCRDQAWNWALRLATNS